MILGRNILVNFGAQAIIFLASFFTTPFIFKGLGQTYYSLLVFFTTVVGFFMAMDFGLSVAFVQFFSKYVHDEKKRKEVFTSSFLIYTAIMFLWAFLIFIFSPFLLSKFFPLVQQVGGISILGLRLFCLVLFVSALSNFLALVFQAMQKFHIFNIRTIFLGVLIPVITALLLLYGKSLMDIIYLHLFVQILVFLYFAVLLREYFSLDNIKLFSFSKVKEILAYAKWKFVGQLCGQLRQKSASFILSASMSLDQLAFLSIPQGLSDRYISLQPNITSPVFTMTAELKGLKKEKSTIYLYKFSVKIVNIIFLSLGVYLFFYGVDFLRIWIGPDFADKAGLVLRVLILAYAISVLNGMPNTYLEGIGKPNLPAYFSILIVIVYLALAFFLVPSYGPLGAAWAAFFTYLLQVPAYLYFVHKKVLKELTWPFIWRAYILPIIMAFLAGFFSLLLKIRIENWFSFIGTFIVYWCIFVTLVLAFGIFDKNERNELKEILAKIWKNVAYRQ